jgi:hypothetical protein
MGFSHASSLETERRVARSTGIMNGQFRKKPPCNLPGIVTVLR